MRRQKLEIGLRNFRPPTLTSNLPVGKLQPPGEVPISDREFPIGEVFNVFNIANLEGYSGTLNALVPAGQTQAATFGQPTTRVSQVFGTGGPRAFQVAARISF